MQIDDQFARQRKRQQNKAMHTKPPIARFANGERVSGGSVIANVKTPETWLVFADRIVSKAISSDRFSCQGDLFCMVRSLTRRTLLTGSMIDGF